MLSQTQMIINLDGTNSPEVSKFQSYIFLICFISFSLINVISAIIAIITRNFFLVPIVMVSGFAVCIVIAILQSIRKSKINFKISYLKDEKSIKIEKNLKNQLNISIPLQTIENVKMNYDETISTFKLYTNEGKEIELFKLYLGPGGIPFIEGEDIFNDWFEF